MSRRSVHRCIACGAVATRNPSKFINVVLGNRDTGRVRVSACQRDECMDHPQWQRFMTAITDADRADTPDIGDGYEVLHRWASEHYGPDRLREFVDVLSEPRDSRVTLRGDPWGLVTAR